MAQEYVYFLSCPPGPIKIGKARDVKSRMAQLQTSLPYKLELMGVMRGGHRLESELHKRFAHIRMHGEWFESAPELVEYVSTNSTTLEHEEKEEAKCKQCERLRAENFTLKDRIKEKLDRNERPLFLKFHTAIGEEMIRYVRSYMWEMVHICRRIEDAVVSFEKEKKYEVQFTHQLRRDLRDATKSACGLPNSDWRMADNILFGDGFKDFQAFNRLASDFLRKRAEVTGLGPETYKIYEKIFKRIGAADGKAFY